MSVYEHLPSYYRVPEGHTYTVQEAQVYTQRLARSHYENFTVVSWFLPRRLRRHMFNVYAYCRWSDDLGDEVPDRDEALTALAWWRGELDACYAGEARHPVFVALADTIREFDVPAAPFHHLLDAFEQDQRVRRYQTFDDVLDYCTRSANPVGRLVLYLFGHRDAERQRLSDCTCTALQLANFWQDVTVDWEKGRAYLPLDDIRRFGVAEEQIPERRFTPQFGDLMRLEVTRARRLFDEGSRLAALAQPTLRRDIRLFTDGGLAILDAIEANGFDVLTTRPVVTTGKKVALMLRRVAGQLQSA